MALGKAYEGLRNHDLAKAQYQLALTKLDYDNDGPPAREEAKRRLAALNQPASVATAPPGTAATPPQATPPAVSSAPKAEPKVAAVPPSKDQQPTLTPGSQNAQSSSQSQTPTPPPPPSVERQQGPSLMCRVLRSFSGHARDYTGLRIETGCGP